MTPYPGPETEVGKKRMAEDANFIGNCHLWPGVTLHLKSQPWLQTRRFATITMDDALQLQWRVTDKSSDRTEMFDSVLDLVEVWSVD